MSESNEIIVRKATEYLSHNLRYKVTIPQLARKVGASEPRLKKLFREILGIGIFHYHRKLKIDHAKEKLLEGATIKEASIDTGYVYETNFVKAFKEVVGITPAQWQKIQRSGGNNAIRSVSVA